MNYKLIMTDNPILVSDEKIKRGDILPYVMKWENGYEVFNLNNGIRESKLSRAYKIIAGIPDLPTLDLSLIAERIGWVNVEKLALDNCKNKVSGHTEQDLNTEIWISGARQIGFKEGFKAAQSLNEKKLFTLADIEEAWESGKKYGTTESEFWNTDSVSRAEYERCETKEDFIQSLSKPKEYNVQYVQEGNKIIVTKIIK